MGKRQRRAAAGLIVAMSLFIFERVLRGRRRWLEHFYPENASRSPLARVLVAALLVISQLTSTIVPAYAQTSPPTLSGSIAGQGTLSSGTFFVDYRLANIGSGFASDIRINQLSVRTLGGTGTVTYDSALSPALPISAGGLAPGAFTTIRFYFSLPSTVTRFSITESGTVQDSAGTTLSFSMSQSIIPRVNKAPVVNAGPDLTVTLPDVATLNGTVTDDGLPAGSPQTIAWSKVSGPGTVTFANVNAAATTATFDQAGTYGLRLTASDSQLSSSDDATVIVNAPAVPSITSATPNSGQQGQQNLNVQLTGQFTHFVQGTTQVGFGAGITVNSVTVANATSLTANISISAGAATDARTVTATTGAEALSLANGFNVTAGTPALLTVNPGSGQQGQQNLNVQIAGQYTNFVQGTTQVGFGAGITVNSVTVANATSLTANISISAGAATGARTVTATTGAEALSLANGFNVTAGTPALLTLNPASGQVGQQNLNVQVTGQFTNFVQGTTQADFGAGISVNTVTVASATSLTANISIAANAALGDRTVTVTTATEVVSRTPGFTVTAGTPALLTVIPNTGQQGQQNLNVQLTGQFTHFVQGTTQVTFGAGITVNTVTVASATGLTASISIAANATLGDRTVTVTTGAEVFSRTPGFTVTPGTPVLLTVSPNSGKQNQANLNVQVTGQFTNFVQGTTEVTFGTGVAVNSLTVANAISLTANVTIANTAPVGHRTVAVTTGTEVVSLGNGFTVTPATTPAPPTVTFATPANGLSITTLTNVTGSVNSSALDSWTLEYKMIDGPAFQPIASGTTNVSNALLGTLDPTLLLNGTVALRLRATDLTGQTSSTQITLVVSGNQKVGNFTVSFRDLTIPMAGFPINIVRTYDSRVKQGGDFGAGWTLDLKSVQLSENQVLGNDWQQTSSGGFFPTYCIQETKPHIVTVTLQDGSVYKFQPTVSPQCQQFAPLQTVTIGFQPLPGTNASLSIGFLDILLTPVLGSLQLIDLDTFAPADPDAYTFSLPDGRSMQLNGQPAVLQSLTDANANKITIGPNGLTHSAGKSVLFQRDAFGRITRITDPAGNTLNYGYDVRGDLASFADQESNSTTYTYNNTHGLLQILDPRGIQPVRNEYDDSGRLVRNIDAFGNVINYTHNTGSRQEVITDRLGNVTLHEYDTAGNIVQTTDALGGVTIRTYDARNNLLTERFPLGQTKTFTLDAQDNRLTETDPLGNTTRYTYNARKQVLTITDPLGRVTTNTYDANGNLLSTRDPLNNTTSYTYDGRGQQTSMTNPVGGVTQSQYDANGNLTRQIDPMGNVTTLTYDANGNKLTETKTRTTPSGPETVVTAYQYDHLNRLVRTTFADGSAAQTTYNSIGKQSIKTDQLGRQTTYAYDAVGRLSQTTFPDGTSEVSTYDAEGHRLTGVDRSGRTTSYQYDKLGRLTRTTFPDGAFTATIYDAAGQVTQTTDELNNVTRFVYDAAGRRTQVIDSLNKTMNFAYDLAGNQASMTDARSNTTQYQYDGNNRRTRVTYPDGTFDATAYDALGRATSKTDQASRITQFQYDALGRLTRVIDSLSQSTNYDYDELSNRISQTDALGRITRFEYDRLGRRTRRILPLGMSETSVYDVAGNLIRKTDFNGKTTTYSYDAANRLLTKVPDPSLAEPTVSFTYTSAGQRASMNDAGGATTYQYNNRDRLTQKATPQGTLTYTYDAHGNLASMRSSNANGTSADYTYDALNRLSAVRDNRQTSGITTYTYDAVGNLSSFGYPNGVQHAYTYNTLNRLTTLNITNAGGQLANYAYTLGAAGNRTSVAEFGGRQVSYAYDGLYRLTNEAITGAGNPVLNGSIGYVFDSVGNRLQRISTIGVIPSQTFTYDPNDRVTTEAYDSNGNTIASGSDAFAFDFENQLKSKNGGQVGIVYDGDGNRAARTTGGVTTRYLVDDRNLTGYAQVLEEISGGAVQRVYTYGLSRITQDQSAGTSFYTYDGQESVRLLTNTIGSITDRYDYDAFGNIVNQTGTTPNVYLYAGEQLDTSIGLYYLRARYYLPASGRFSTADSFEGNLFKPSSLHRYLYVAGNPVNSADPSGQQELTLQGMNVSLAIQFTLAAIATVILAQILSKVRFELPIRLNHYTTFIGLGFIIASGSINSPSGTNFFTPDWYFSSSTAKSSLALRQAPDVLINLNLFLGRDNLLGPQTVAPANGELGGGLEYYTNQPVPLWTRFPGILPLF